MNLETEKLNRVRKSCGTVRKVAKVLKILSIVAAVIALIMACVIFAMRGQIADEITALDASGKISFNAGGAGFIMTQIAPEDSIPMTVITVIYLVEIMIICLATAVIMHMIGSAFGIIEGSESPFTDLAIRKLNLALIIVCVIVGLFAGIQYGILLGIITWAIYTILDYGRVLQVQADETL